MKNCEKHDAGIFKYDAPSKGRVAAAGCVAVKDHRPGHWQSWVSVLVILLFLSPRLFAAQSFVVGLQNVEVVDTAIDALGVTYVLAKNGAGNCVLTKFDPSGAQLRWTGDLATSRVISNLTPNGFCVAPGATNSLYIVGNQRIVRVSVDTGSVAATLNVPSSFSPRSVYFWNDAVFVAGNYTGTGTTTIFGRSAAARGTQAAVLVKLTANLSATASGLTTYGGSSGSNTAESLAVDEAGDIYVSGHFAGGALNLDGSISSSGQWRVELFKSSANVGSLGDALSVLAGNDVTSVDISYHDIINFGTGSEGWFGNDSAFPDGATAKFVLRATGTIWISNNDTYEFISVTDDGTRVLVDGTNVLEFAQSRGAAATKGTIYLNRGLHTVEYLMFQGGGPTSAEFLYRDINNQYIYWLQPTRLRDARNKAYVAKFNPTFSTILNAYFTSSESLGNGGSFHELSYDQGWIYATGFWQGQANNPELGLIDNATGSSTDVDIVKLDTNLKLKGRATVKGAANIEGYSVTSDNDGNVYVTGSYGPGSVDFVGNGDRSPSDAAQDRKFTSRSSSKQSLFAAKLDSNMDYRWVNQPSGSVPDSFSKVAKVRWNDRLQRVFWTGSFANGSLSLGQPETLVTLNGTQGFLTVLDPTGPFTEQVLLTVVSDFGDSGTQIKPFGGPLVGNNVTGTNQQSVIKGIQVTASVPKNIFRKGSVDVTTDVQADTRIRSTGYSVDNSVATGDAESYTFTISKDTLITFNWAVDYALNIDADLSATVGTGDPANGIPGVSGISSLASGNPVPAVQKHWIGRDETVIATIDSEVLDLNNPGLPIKYLVTGYDASGPSNPLNSSGTQTNFIPFAGIETRRQVPQFVMNGPAWITYRWKLKIGVQVNTTGPQSSGFPLVKVIRDPGQTNSLPPTQPDGVGTGTFYFDEHTTVEIGTVRNQGVVQLKGWLNGDGFVFANSGTLSNLTTSFDVAGTNYASRRIQRMVRPARVMWDYGDRIFEETVYLGNAVTFNTVDDLSVKAILRSDLPPDRVDLNEGPQGSTGTDMAIWDATGKKFYPLRPGVVMSYWLTSNDPAARVIVRLIFKYSPSPHYRHIADTPPVDLDPSDADFVSFKELKYTEAGTGAGVDSEGHFTASGSGKTVLLFSESSSPGRGDRVETVRVRVVETKRWNDLLPPTQTALIGQKITSSYDTAGLNSGYVFFSAARYNPFIYDRENVSGPIIPVNLYPSAAPNEQMVVVWYERRDTLTWPYQAVQYTPAWPTLQTGLNRIVMASRFGSESVAADGTDQIVTPAMTVGTNSVPAERMLNPSRFQQVQIYNQPDRAIPGFNPNEEHALLAPSLRFSSVSPRPMAAYALRDKDLNVTARNATHTSDPYVLVQFFDSLEQEYKMKVYEILRASTNLNVGDLSYKYSFDQEIEAGEPVIPFYPLPSVIGATPCPGTYGKDGQPTVQRCFWRDHKGTGWAVSGDSFFTMYFYYPLSPDFWWPPSDPKLPGDCVAWLPVTNRYSPSTFSIDYRRNDQIPPAQAVTYTSVWPQDVPVLKVGETLTFPGGEYSQDNPTTIIEDPDSGEISSKATPGLPGVVGWASGEIVFDTLNPLLDPDRSLSSYTARLFPALEEREVSLSIGQFPSDLLPATKRTRVKNGNYIFNDLSSSLQKRIYFDPINGRLVMKGLLNDKDIGDSTLTASPPAVYALEPNIMTVPERDSLLALSSETDWAAAVQQLYILSRNPSGIDRDGDGIPDETYGVGLSPQTAVDSTLRTILVEFTSNINALVAAAGYPASFASAIRDNIIVFLNRPLPQKALGPGLAVTANAAFLDPANPTLLSYVTLVENNDESLGSAPVTVHVVKVDKSQRYRGAIKTILSDNVFDENIILRHTGDFGGNAEDLVFEWWYRPEDGTTALTPDRVSPPNPWKLFGDPSGRLGQGFYQLTLKGNPSAPEALLADSLFYVRYRHKDEVPDGVNWEVPQANGSERCVLNVCEPGIPYDWAGAGNSTPQDLNEDGLPDYRPQLAQGWIKRVLDAVNPYEARIRDFSADNPATYSSMIRQLGAQFEGPVALNPDKDVIENVGLIALYQTILNRGRDLSIDLSTPLSTPSIANALQLASTRLSDFYTLLGNEAYADAKNPTIGFGSGSVEYGHLAPAVFSFQNQLSSLLDEELGLLRGLDDFKGSPVYNRLFWNFTKGEGEAAYAMNYNISDVNTDGFIDEDDAMILYPQGHGDAWGHYVTAIKMQYELLRHREFNWVSRSEFYNLQDVVISVDFLDERKFAQVAAAKAKAGAEIVNMTYREKYVADPHGQWQGYTDTDRSRSWGVEEWARRAGQGCYFDWVTANAILPAQHPNTNYTGIQKVDRTTVQDIAVVAANHVAIQTTMEQVNKGYNPLGLAAGALAFDMNPAEMAAGKSHFDQVYERAVGALRNASTIFDHANQLDNMVRKVANTEEQFRNQVFEEDLSYRNQLLEIFGSPYSGTIGSGKAYPPGYLGPDVMLYMYVDVNNVNDDTVPQSTAAYNSNFVAEITGDHALARTTSASAQILPGVPNEWRTRYDLSFLNQGYDAVSIHYSDFSDPENPPGAPLPNLDLPIMASGYTFVAPAEWNRRSSPGELQRLITRMVQAQADLNNALSDWDGVQLAMIGKLKKINAKFDYDDKVRDLKAGQIAFDTTLSALGLAFKVVSAASEVAAVTAEEAADAVKEAIPVNTPTAGLSVSLGDALSAARSAIRLTGFSAKAALTAVKVGFDKLADGADVAKALGDAIFELETFNREKEFDLISDLLDLQTDYYEESGLRTSVFKQVQILAELSDQYRATLANGFRLIEQRTAFNKRVAAQTQKNRYQDVTFRVARNAALEKYRSAFDLAARYAYLAGTAFDYDTNLGWDDAGSPAKSLAAIVQQRTVGLMSSVSPTSQPAIGAGGLAEELAKLKANYDTLKTRLGLNNPQLETATFSLRSEALRILSDTNSDFNWRQALRSSQFYKNDLWQVPEFRRYCRPFSSATNGAQPGLVIPFSSQIRPNKNFFGWPLGGMDSSYDPTVYATRIKSAGVWFAGYDTANLAQTPRVYLIPAGQDIMTVPTDPDLSVRIWDVVDQSIPVPYPSISASLNDPAWKPLTDSLNGIYGDARQFSSFRASGFNSTALTPSEQSTVVLDNRLVGRSAWNTRWILIIPGATFNADPAVGLDRFIDSVRDIKLVINSYGYSGN